MQVFADRPNESEYIKRMVIITTLGNLERELSKSVDYELASLLKRVQSSNLRHNWLADSLILSLLDYGVDISVIIDKITNQITKLHQT